MNPPKSFDVLGTTWTVRYDADEVNDNDEWGNANTRKREVTFHPDGDHPTLFVHELFHTIEHALNLQRLSEENVQGLARGLVATLKNDRKLREWLWEALDG